MTVYLGVAILLFVMITFVPREGFGVGYNKKGYYSDSNVTGAVEDLTALNKKLTILKTTLNDLTTTEYSAMDAISSVGKVLLTKNSEMYKGGVITAVQDIKTELDEYQTDVMTVNHIMNMIQKGEMVYLYDKNKKTNQVYTLSGAVDKLIERSKDIASTLNKIPAA